ncbi:D-aminoacyl-tRNA deacylase-like isoform X2 [Durio zibethinus]|uniref:D-aminoacyl-tRNA deacylase-like isoform X2 n=1 Tax=Durio zibethinus TaxID=66656 RepID=A0A6P5Y7U1_DURZI|nr:D-aminoacyl-tRNA deacylase-like isoform X2 [Durio zibethinus]
MQTSVTHMSSQRIGCSELHKQGGEANKTRQATRRREPFGQALGGSHRRDCQRRRVSQQACTPHVREGEALTAGGKPGWAAPPNPRIGPWFRLLKNIAHSHNLVPEFEVTLEATHHGPEINSPTMFVEIGSAEEYWYRQDAAQAIALCGKDWVLEEELQ